MCNSIFFLQLSAALFNVSCLIYPHAHHYYNIKTYSKYVRCSHTQLYMCLCTELWKRWVSFYLFVCLVGATVKVVNFTYSCSLHIWIAFDLHMSVYIFHFLHTYEYCEICLLRKFNSKKSSQLKIANSNEDLRCIVNYCYSRIVFSFKIRENAKTGNFKQMPK